MLNLSFFFLQNIDRILGKGVYFARTSEIPHMYTNQLSGYHSMIKARVLLGDLSVGYDDNSQLTDENTSRPIKKNMSDSSNFIKYHNSSCDAFKQTFCIYDNYQAYPEYLITYY
jgi:hypothetical protein